MKLFNVNVVLEKRGRERTHMNYRYAVLAESAEQAKAIVQKEMDGDEWSAPKKVKRMGAHESERGYILCDIGSVSK